MKSIQRLIVESLAIVVLCAIAISFLPSSTPTFQSGAQRALPDLPVIENTGLTIHKEEFSSPGLTLIPQSGTEEVLLVNMKGETVHRWKFDAMRARLLPNCNLLVLHGTKWGIERQPWRSMRDYVREYDWEGNLVWEYKAKNTAHHDVHRLENGNTLFLHRDSLPRRFREQIRDPLRREMRIRPDEILEVTPSGEIAWHWKAWEHFSVNRCGPSPCPMMKPESKEMEKNSFDWTHANGSFPLPENRWFDSGDTRFRPGNILLTVRNWSTVYIIDRQTGKPVWEYSGEYEGGLSGGHEAHMIPPGFPGAGNILIFDNGRWNHFGESYLLEVNPKTKKPVWIYDVGEMFFSPVAGSVQRLKNGNTLVSEDFPGRIFEVTPEKQIVWQYQSPVRTCRAHRYDYDYCERFTNLPQ